MTSEEFDLEAKESLEGTPLELHSVLVSMAYERGHSAGYHEVLAHLQGYVNDLREPILKYGERIKKETGEGLQLMYKASVKENIELKADLKKVLEGG